MITSFLIAFVVACFCGYVFFDAMSVLSRIAASLLNTNAFGSSIEKIMSTLKRLSIFLYPPALGYFLVNGDRESLFAAIFLSYFAGAVSLILIISFKGMFLRFFVKVAGSFAQGVGVVGSIIGAFTQPNTDIDPQILSDIKGHGLTAGLRHTRLILLGSWVYFVFGASIFVVNIAALNFMDYAPIILQSLGFFNGLGTLVLAFLVDPIVARFLDRQERQIEAGGALLLAQTIGVSIYAPLAFFGLYMFQ